MMARGSSRGRRPGSGRSPLSRSSYRNGSVEIFLRPQHSRAAQLLGLVVRSRAELTVLATLLVARYWAWPRLDEWAGHTTALLAVTALILGSAVVPASRRFWVRRWWSVTTRHRMRACYKQTRTMTFDGKLPYLLWSRPSPVGEKVRVWLPAGLAVKDLEQARDELAAACWASDVRVTPSRRQAALAVVDVVRHDPLTGDALRPQVIDTADPVYDPATPNDWSAWSNPDTAGEGQPDTRSRTGETLPPRDTLPPPSAGNTDGHTTTVGSTNGRGTATGKSRTRKDPASTDLPEKAGEPPVTGYGEVDVSDYL